MFDFENKPVKDWTLEEAKEYCMNRAYDAIHCYGESCILKNTNSCIGIFANMQLKDNTITKFTPDEIAFCRLIKKTYPQANYIAKGSMTLIYSELRPVFTTYGYFESGNTGRHTIIDYKFFPQIKPLTYYAIDDIIKQGDDNNA